MDEGSSEFDKVSTSMYSVLAYVGVGSTGLWAFFRSQSVPLSAAEVRFHETREPVSPTGIVGDETR